MPFGYMGKILWVDLSTETIENQELPEEIYKSYIGGRGLSARILYDDLSADLDPLHPNNEVIFMTGPYTGMAAPGAARFEITTLSPLTKFLGAANAGGFFGSSLKRAGFDGVVIRGKAKDPVYLWVNEDEAELKDATNLWGKDTFETEDLIKAELENDRIRIASIGQAGENLIPYAAVMCDKGRAAARSGAAAVLGSKNFKAIACFGKKQVQIAHKEKFQEVIAYYNKKVKDDPIFQLLQLYGSNGFLIVQLITGDVPVKNWTKSNFDGAEKISGHAMYEKILVRDKACQGCVVSCKRSVRIDHGKYKLSKNPASGPEYETVASFGPLCMVDNLYAITKANDLCNRYGLDTISAGNVIAFAMECYEKGLITKEDLGGLELNWGDPDALIACIELITKKQHLGALLSQGTKRASQEIEGSENFSVTVKGLEVAMHDPRSNQLLGLHYSTTPYGARHSSAAESFVAGLSALPLPDLDFIADPDDRALDRLSPIGKAKPLITMQDRGMMLDCGGFCSWYVVFPTISPHYMSAMITLITGWKMRYRDIFLKTGERISNLIQAFNIKHGLTMKDFELPYRLTKEPAKEGGSKGIVVYLEPMLREYFELRQWDRVTGKPKAEKLQELGLDDIARDLWE